jgi:hypothetical protein
MYSAAPLFFMLESLFEKDWTIYCNWIRYLSVRSFLSVVAVLFDREESAFVAVEAAAAAAAKAATRRED